MPEEDRQLEKSIRSLQKYQQEVFAAGMEAKKKNAWRDMMGQQEEEKKE